jgi:integrase
MAELYKRHGRACALAGTKRTGCKCPWWGRWHDPEHGHQRESLKTTDKAVARSRLRGKELGEAAPVEVEETIGAALDYVTNVHCAQKATGTAESYRKKAKRLREFFNPEAAVADISREDVNAYIQQRYAQGRKAHTIHKELIVLRLALQYANERGACDDPRRTVPKFSADYKPGERWLTRDEFDRLLAATPMARKVWVALMVFAGADTVDVERMRRCDVDLEADRVRLRGTKARSRDRYVPIDQELRPWLDLAVRAHELEHGAADLMFETWHNPGRDLAVYCKAAKVSPAVTPKDLRRTFGSWLKQAGVDSKAVADMMGHTTTRMVDMTYGHLSDEVYRDAIAKMPRGRRLKVVK